MLFSVKCVGIYNLHATATVKIGKFQGLLEYTIIHPQHVLYIHVIVHIHTKFCASKNVCVYVRVCMCVCVCSAFHVHLLRLAA